MTFLRHVLNKILHIVLFKIVLGRAPMLEPNTVINFLILFSNLRNRFITIGALLVLIKALIANKLVTVFARSWVDHESETLIAGENS